MELLEAIRGRRAVREYSARAVDDTAIRALTDAAVQAPSAVNQQPWTFTIVRDRALLDRISRDAKEHMLRTLVADEHEVKLRAMLTDPGYHIFHNAPALVLVSAVAAGSWIVEECAMAAENLMLAAHATGLGSCWIGFAQSYLNTPHGKALLGIPQEWVPVAPIALGHPKAASAAVARKDPIVLWVD